MTAHKEYTFSHNEAPNLMSHREKTRKAGKCQLCGVKAKIEDQYTVANDLDAGTVVKRKNAARKGAEKMSHYCEDCATKRVKQKQAWLDAREAKKNGKAKPAPKKAKKAPAKGKKSSGKKAPAKRRKKTVKASPKAVASASEVF